MYNIYILRHVMKVHRGMKKLIETGRVCVFNLKFSRSPYGP